MPRAPLRRARGSGQGHARCGRRAPEPAKELQGNSTAPAYVHAPDLFATVGLLGRLGL